MVYGVEVVLPIELEVLSLHVFLQQFIDDGTYRQDRLAHLDLIDEKCISALQHLRVYQERIKRAYNKRVYLHEFEVGNLVLKENQQITRQPRAERGNFAHNWMDPYIVLSKYGSSTYKLVTLEGVEELEPINIIHLQSFYT